jgi:hypothetical protein
MRDASSTVGRRRSLRRLLLRKEWSVMVQQGQVFMLKTTGTDENALWAYRYRVGGRGSRRVQRGGFATADDAGEAIGSRIAFSTSFPLRAPLAGGRGKP